MNGKCNWNRLARLGWVCLMFWLGISAAKAAEIERKFAWRSFGEQETLVVKVPATLHLHYATKTRTYQYGDYLLEDQGYELASGLAAAFQRRAQKEGYNEWELVNLVIDFVQSLEYQTETGEYPKYPIETLKDGGGDCEDTAILLSAVLDELGFDCVMLSPPGHMAVGLAITGATGKHYVYAGKNYYYVETTGMNWEVGAIPKQYDAPAKVYPLPESVTAKRTVAVPPDSENDLAETMILMAFYRSPSGLVDPKSRKTVYWYKVHLETDDATLADVLEVQYRRLDPEVKEVGLNPWMRAYDAGDRFEQSWTASCNAPVQVRIFFKDGTMVQNVIDFAPKISTN